MTLSPKQFRILLVLQLVIAIVGSVIDTIFPNLMPAPLRSAENTLMAGKSMPFLTSIAVAGISFLILRLAATVGLLLFRRWGRTLAVVVTAIWFAFNPIIGMQVQSGWTASVGDASTLLWGVLLALAYFSPLREKFENKTALPSQTMPMYEEISVADLPVPSSAGRPSRALLANLLVGLRGFFFLPLALQEKNVTWSQLIFLIVAALALQFGWDFAHVGIGGHFVQYGLPGALFGVPVVLLAAWVLASLARRQDKTLSLVIAFSAIGLLFDASQLLVQWAYSNDMVQALAWSWSSTVHHVIVAWFALACAVATIRLFGMPAWKKISTVLVAIVVIGVPLSQIYRGQTLWALPYDRDAAAAQRAQENLLNTEDLFYLQPKLLERELAAIQPSNKDGINLFFVGVAGYADQDVFMKEIHYVSKLFQERFGTAGHSVMLINNPKTARQTPIASGTSLQLALKQVAAMMDPSKDILFLYLTSHGSKDHKFSLDFGSMEFNDLDPKRLRQILDASGIKRQVVVIAACYSGGFIDALKSENTVVITSAAPDRTSFGCGNEEEFTYFGKAYFDEALHKTDSFIDAFELAKPVIAAREKADNFTPSDPRIFVGDAIKAPLAEFSRQIKTSRVAKTLGSYQQDRNPDKSQIVVPAPKTPVGNTPDTDRQEVARDLVKLMQYDTVIQDAIKHCKEIGIARKPEELVKANPNYFKGITPQSPLWPRVVAAYREYFDTSCNYIGNDDYLSVFVQAYSSSLTTDALKESMKFYSTPTGKKLISATLAADIALQDETSANMATASEKASAQYNKKLAELSALEEQSGAVQQPKATPWWHFFD